MFSGSYREVCRNPVCYWLNSGPDTPAKRGDYIPAQESVSVDAPEALLKGQPDSNAPDRQMCHCGDSVTPDKRTFHGFMAQTTHRPDSTEEASKEGRQVQRTFSNTSSTESGVTLIPPDKCRGPHIDHDQVPADASDDDQVIHAKYGPFQTLFTAQITGEMMGLFFDSSLRLCYD